FAAAFLQIPPRGGHPWLELMATATFTTPDFHRIDNAHAGRTNVKRPATQVVSNQVILFYKPILRVTKPFSRY
ncbi:hypothetical protein, partial [Alicyclobacillus ferrooxydans]|uniref:hypothetical protein n=1 Tax=Alicyclobacillus ferrooxydans TaxID=471514 RepID=UPI000A9EA348